MKTKITNCWILTMNQNMDVYKNGEIIIEDDKIVYVGEASNSQVDHLVDAKGGIVMPGMVNTHCHVAMIPFRSLGDDCPDRLRRFLFPLENQCMNPHLTYLASKYGIVEMLTSGITTFVDMYYFVEEIARACHEVGIRACLGETVINQETCDSKEIYGGLAIGETLFKNWNDYSLVQPILAPHATNTNEACAFQKAMKMVNDYQSLLTTHASEMDYEMKYFDDTYQMTPIQWLDSIGCLNERVLLAHCIHLTSDDMKLIASKGATISHCISSNMKAGKGIAPLKEMQEAGITVGLGTDGPSSSNTLELFTTMRLIAQSQKTKYHDRSLYPAKDIVRLATIEGAKAIHLEDTIGSLEVGKQADILIVDTNSIHMFPIHDPYSALVYSANSSDVKDVFVAGKHLVKNRELDFDIQQLKQELSLAMCDFNRIAKEREAAL